MKRRFTLSLFAFLFAATFLPVEACIISSEGNRPKWIRSYQRSLRRIGDSHFFVEFNKARTLNDARAVIELQIEAAQRDRTGSRDGENIQVRSECLAEHVEFRNGEYYVWRLTRTARKPGEMFERIPYRTLRELEKTDLGLKPFVPGMAQIHRGSNAGGVLFITGISALGVGVVTTEVLRADNDPKVKTTFNVAKRREYMDNAANLQNTRNILIAATGAVYLWNVIDGFVGASRYGISANRRALSDFKMVPYADFQSGGGLALSFNFGKGDR